jgi:cytoskeletal protein CcmA (bactofilin family)
LTVNGTSTLTNGLSVTGGNVAVTNSFSAGADSSFNAKLAVAGNTSLAARLNVTGDVSMNGNATVANKINAPHIVAGTDLTIAGDLKIYNDGTNSVIDATSGNIYLNPGLSNTHTGLVHIKNGLTVDGSINFTGEWIRTDTNVQFTTQIDVSNNGTGPAIKCEQKGVNDVAYFLDDNFPVMKVLQGHKVAICKDTASVALDVSGSINADANLTVTGTTTLTGDLSSTNGNIALTNGNVVLTNGKITTKTFEATSDATFDAKISMVGSGNFDMTGTTGFLCQW